LFRRTHAIKAVLHIRHHVPHIRRNNGQPIWPMRASWARLFKVQIA